MTSLHRNLSLLILLIVFTPVSFFMAETDPPIIDGVKGADEWNNGDRRIVPMADGSSIVATVLFNSSHIFILLEVADDDPTLFGSSISWDGFGIEFDINGDQVPMGTFNSPDDAILVSYRKKGAEDFFLQGMGNPSMADTTLNGTDDVIGEISIFQGTFVVEIVKELNTGDTIGNDIAFQSPGYQFQVLFAYWDNTISSDAGIVQTTSHSQWIDYELPGGIENKIFQMLTDGIIIAGFILLSIIVRFRFNQKFLNT